MNNRNITEDFTPAEAAILEFVRSYLKVPKDFVLTRDTLLKRLVYGPHTLGDLGYELEKRFGIEFTDEQGWAIELGRSIQTMLRILKIHGKV